MAGKGCQNALFFDVRSILGVQHVSENFSLYMVLIVQSAKLAFSSFSKSFYSHYETVILVIIHRADRQPYSVTYAREIFALSNKHCSAVGATFGKK